MFVRSLDLCVTATPIVTQRDRDSVLGQALGQTLGQTRKHLLTRAAGGRSTRAEWDPGAVISVTGVAIVKRKVSAPRGYLSVHQKALYERQTPGQSGDQL